MPPRSLVVISDLDGTLLPGPYGMPPVTPPISAGPAYAALMRLLEAGATVIGVTGSGYASHAQRFFRDLPVAARIAGRVLLAVETGRRLYRGSAVDGEPEEDLSFTAFQRARVRPFTEATVARLVQIGREGLARFFTELGQDEDASIIQEGDPLAFLRTLVGTADATHPPVSEDVSRVKRIEIREGGSAVVFVGIPSRVGERYLTVPDDLAHLVDGKPTGRMCFDCVPTGLSKSLVVDFLLQTGEVVPGRAVALGDQPMGNDAGLTQWHPEGSVGSSDQPEGMTEAAAARAIPFISVAERSEMVPPHLQAWHVRAHGGNVGASGAVLHALADAEEAARREGGNGARVDLNAARELVRRANGDEADGERMDGAMEESTAGDDRSPPESVPAEPQGQPAGATLVTARSLSWSRGSEEPVP